MFRVRPECERPCGLSSTKQKKSRKQPVGKQTQKEKSGRGEPRARELSGVKGTAEACLPLFSWGTAIRVRRGLFGGRGWFFLRRHGGVRREEEWAKLGIWGK